MQIDVTIFQLCRFGEKAKRVWENVAFILKVTLYFGFVLFHSSLYAVWCLLPIFFYLVSILSTVLISFPIFLDFLVKCFIPICVNCFLSCFWLLSIMSSMRPFFFPYVHCSLVNYVLPFFFLPCNSFLFHSWNLPFFILSLFPSLCHMSFLMSYIIFAVSNVPSIIVSFLSLSS